MDTPHHPANVTALNPPHPSANITPLNPPQRTVTFHPFPTLPLELRIQIWKLSLPPPRIITINKYHGFLQGTPSITLLWTSRESRAVALERYTPWGPCTPPDLNPHSPHLHATTKPQEGHKDTGFTKYMARQNLITTINSPCPHSPFYQQDPFISGPNCIPDPNSCLRYTYVDFQADLFICYNFRYMNEVTKTSEWAEQFPLARTAMLQIKRAVLLERKLPALNLEKPTQKMHSVVKMPVIRRRLLLTETLEALEEWWVVIGEGREGRLMEVLEGDGGEEGLECDWLREDVEEFLGDIGGAMRERRMPVLRVGKFVVD